MAHIVTPVLDDHAKDLLRRLHPGVLFTLKDEKNVVCEVTEVRHPIECLPLVRAYEMEGPKGHRTHRMYRGISLDRVERILPSEE